MVSLPLARANGEGHRGERKGDMPLWVQAQARGLVADAALFVGAAIMALGSGVLIVGLSSLIGYTAFSQFSSRVIATTNAIAAGMLENDAKPCI